MVVTKELYNTKDVAEIRAILLKEQKGKDLLTGLPLDTKDAVCDHNHESQYVRGIIHRQSNAVLGKIENMWKRYMAWWYTGTLPLFLRNCADYIERKEDTRYVHPAWIKQLSIQFGKLSSANQIKMLDEMLNSIDDESDIASNGKDRRVQYEKLLKTKKFTYVQLKGLYK